LSIILDGLVVATQPNGQVVLGETYISYHGVLTNSDRKAGLVGETDKLKEKSK
jgi:hypothetical protein